MDGIVSKSNYKIRGLRQTSWNMLTVTRVYKNINQKQQIVKNH